MAAALHPAMLLYLDNWTLGRATPPTRTRAASSSSCTRSAGPRATPRPWSRTPRRSCPGYTVDAFETWDGFYDPSRHTTGAGPGARLHRRQRRRRRPASSPWTTCATWPTTRRRRSPSPASSRGTSSPTSPRPTLVTTVAAVFRDSGTDITATLRALVAHPDFTASGGPAACATRSRTSWPPAGCCGVTRASGPPVDSRSPGPASTCRRRRCSTSGPAPTACRSATRAWSSATRMLSSFRMHWDLAAGWWPTTDVAYRAPASWLPQRLHAAGPVRRPPLPGAAGQAVSTPAAGGRRGGHRVHPPPPRSTATHALAGWMFVRLVGVLLDSPDHMRR